MIQSADSRKMEYVAWLTQDEQYDVFYPDFQVRHDAVFKIKAGQVAHLSRIQIKLKKNISLADVRKAAWTTTPASAFSTSTGSGDGQNAKRRKLNDTLGQNYGRGSLGILFNPLPIKDLELQNITSSLYVRDNVVFMYMDRKRCPDVLKKSEWVWIESMVKRTVSAIQKITKGHEDMDIDIDT